MRGERERGEGEAEMKNREKVGSTEAEVGVGERRETKL